jgi:hypothetical protein
MTPSIKGWFDVGRSDRKSNRPIETVAKLFRADDERRDNYVQGWNFQDTIEKEIASLPKPQDPPKAPEAKP